jgi:hypothetical protein
LSGIVAVVIIRGVQRFGLEPDGFLAVIQGQIDGYAKKPGIKAASGLESINVLYYFDKGFLGKFRSIIGICTDFQDNVIDAVLILKNKAFHCRRTAKAALLNEQGIVNVDIGSFCHAFFPQAKGPIKTGKNAANTGYSRKMPNRIPAFKPTSLE